MEQFSISAQRENIRGHRLYFIFLVIDTFRMVLDVVGCVVFMVMTQSMAKKFGVPDADLTPGLIWCIRGFLLIAILIQLGINYLGWRGYNQLIFSPIAIYATTRLLTALLLIFSLINAFNVIMLIVLIFAVITSIVAFQFAFEVRKIRSN